MSAAGGFPSERPARGPALLPPRRELAPARLPGPCGVQTVELIICKAVLNLIFYDFEKKQKKTLTK